MTEFTLRKHSIGSSKWIMVAGLAVVGVMTWFGYFHYNRKRKLNELKNAVQYSDKTVVNESKVEVNDVENCSSIEKAHRFRKEGNNAFILGKYTEAISFYTKAIEACPKVMTMDLATFYQNRAAAYIKKWTIVKNDTTKQLELNLIYVKNLKDQCRRKKQSNITNYLAQALDDMIDVCILENFQNQTSLFIADQILNKLGAQYAKEAIENKQPIMPSKHFIRVYLSEFIEDPLLLKYLKDDLKLNKESKENEKGFLRAVAALKQQNYDEIIPACTEEIELSELDVQFKLEAKLLRGTFYFLLSCYSDAITDLQEIIADSKSADIKLQANALIKMANLNMHLEKPNESFINFNQAYELDPNNCDLYYYRAHAQLLLGNLQLSRDDFTKTVKLNPNHATANAHKCYVEYQQAVSEMNFDKLQKIYNDFEKVILKFPNCSDCYLLYAKILRNQQHFEKANQILQKAIQIDQGNPIIYVQLAILQLQWQNDLDQSINLINKALQLDDKYRYAYEKMGLLEVQRGNLKRAVELFDKAILLGNNLNELSLTFSLKNGVYFQQKIFEKMGIVSFKDQKFWK